MIIGIDLGTTNSVAGWVGAKGPELFQGAVGESLVPSVVGVDDGGEIVVGQIAREMQVLHPERCAATFKRQMGTEWTCSLAGREFTAVTLSSLVLGALKADAEAKLGEPVTRAVITVPAYFNEHQRRATLQAGELAGFKVERIVNEPTAAALAYGLHESEQEKVIVVLDLGGGTFDVTVVDFFERSLEVRASSGENFLGGEDFTNTIAGRLLQQQGLVYERAEFEQPLRVARLRQQCEIAKRLLSRQAEATIRFPNEKGDFPENSPTLTVTRQEFESWTSHLLDRIEVPIRRALGDAGLSRSDVAEVILVGGATRMPAFVERVVKLFGKQPRCTLNPDEVVALGAAVQAGLITGDQSVSDMVVTDVAPFTMGIETSKEFGEELRDGYFLPVINRNTTIPVSRVKRVLTVFPNQTTINVKIFQGESRRVENNILLGNFDVNEIQAGPPGQEIDIRFTYDLNGVLEVEATVVATKRKVSHVVTKHARGLSPGQVKNALAAMQSLKVLAREDAVNRLLLRRAERIYQELPLDARQDLDRLLDGFEQILETGSKEEIAEYRDALAEFLSQFDSEGEGQAADAQDW